MKWYKLDRVQPSSIGGRLAILALGELSPEFKGKQVILALCMDGQPL